MQSEVIYRSGGFGYRFEDGFMQWPAYGANPQVAGLCVHDGKLIVVSRSPYPVAIYTLQGAFVRGFGAEQGFVRSHGVCVTKADTLLVCDDGRHVIYEFSMDGQLIKTLGTLDVPCDNGYDPSVSWPHDLYTIQCAGEPFNHPTRLIEAPNGDLYCCDGYGNASIHRFGRDGALKMTWGGPGRSEGQFRLPHSLCADANGNLWVCDRENDRVQVFDENGTFLTSFEKMNWPSEPATDGEFVYVVEREFVSIYNLSLELVARLGYPGSPVGGHSITVAPNGDLYIGCISAPCTVHRLVRI